jgi:hypothetical protein
LSRLPAAVALFSLCACGDRGSGSEPSAASSNSAVSREAAGSSESAAALAVAEADFVVFDGAPLELHDLKVAIGAAGGVTDIDVRARAVVEKTGSGRVELPIKISCQAGDHRVFAVSKLVAAAGERHNLEKTQSTNVKSEAPSWMSDRARACEITIRLSPIGKAKETTGPLEETVCWSAGTLKKPPCELPPPALPTALHTVHDVDGNVSPGVVTVHAYYRSSSPTVPRGSLAAVATCGAAAPSRGFSLIKRTDPFPLLPGESVPVAIEIERKPRAEDEHESGLCSVALSWNEWQTSDSAKPGEPIELGKWCVEGKKISAGDCP